MNLQFRFRGDVDARLRSQLTDRVQAARQDLVRQATCQTLQSIVRDNPVETGQSRAAWVNGLEQLGGTAPPGWEGAAPTGVESGRTHGSGEQEEGAGTTLMRVRNQISYVRYLEYGTSRMAPFAMVRRGLLQIRPILKDLFRLEQRTE